MNYKKVRGVLIKILLATLVATASVAVVMILVGSITDIMSRVIWTLIAAIFYVVILLSIISTVTHIGIGPRSRSALFVVNGVLAITCASYVTTILSIWGVITDDMPTKIHLAYLVFLVGILYAKPLIDIEETHTSLRNYIKANYAFITLSSILTAIAILAPDEWNLWDSLLGRSVAATVVINVTLSMIVTVLYHLDIQEKRALEAKNNPIPTDKDPENTTTKSAPLAVEKNTETVQAPIAVASENAQPQAPEPKRPMSVLKITLIVLFIIFFGLPITAIVLGIISGILKVLVSLTSML